MSTSLELAQRLVEMGLTRRMVNELVPFLRNVCQPIALGIDCQIYEQDGGHGSTSLAGEEAYQAVERIKQFCQHLVDLTPSAHGLPSAQEAVDHTPRVTNDSYLSNPDSRDPNDRWDPRNQR